MNIWYLLKCWLKILMIARQEKVNTNVVMSKILKSNNSLESLPFLPFYLSISCAFWYTIVTMVGSVLNLLYPVSNGDFLSLKDVISGALINVIIIFILIFFLLPLYILYPYNALTSYFFKKVMLLYVFFSLMVVNICFLLLFDVVMFIYIFVANATCLFFINLYFSNHKSYRMYCKVSLFQKYSNVYIRVYTSNEDIDNFRNIKNFLSVDHNYNRQLYKLYSNIDDHLQLVNKQEIIPLLKLNSSLQFISFSNEDDETFSLCVYNEVDNYKKSYILFFEKQVENSIKLIDYTDI